MIIQSQTVIGKIFAKPLTKGFGKSLNVVFASLRKFEFQEIWIGGPRSDVATLQKISM